MMARSSALANAHIATVSRMPDRWEVFVTSEGVRGCTGSFRYLWRARLEAHSKRRYWPGPKQVEIMRTHDFKAQSVCPSCGIAGVQIFPGPPVEPVELDSLLGVPGPLMTPPRPDHSDGADA